MSQPSSQGHLLLLLPLLLHLLLLLLQKATTSANTTESDYNCYYNYYYYYYYYCYCFFYQQLLLHPGQFHPSCELEVLLRRTVPVTTRLSLLPQNRGVLLHSYSLKMGLLL